MLPEVLPVRFAGLRESSGTCNRICTNSGPILIEFGMGPGFYAIQLWPARLDCTWTDFSGWNRQLNVENSLILSPRPDRKEIMFVLYD